MNISILGCGWLGLPLARHLIKDGHTIEGSTTTADKLPMLKKESIEPYKLVLNPTLVNPATVEGFWQSEILVINIPPGRGQDDVVDFHPKQIKSIQQALADSPIEFVIFISSTSVYPSHPGHVREEDAIPGAAGRASGNALLQAENLLMESSDFHTTVIRLGGLYGGDRHPVKYMAGRKNLKKAKAPVNLIHRSDVIAIIQQIINQKITGEIFNAVADNHPSRSQYYHRMAEKWGLEPPHFASEPEKENHYKVVSNQKLKKQLGYAFMHLHLFTKL